MAFSTSSLQRLWLLFTVIFLSAYYSNGEDGAAGIVGDALECFNDRYVYSSCQESYRLTAQGSLTVPPQGTDEFCDGPCLEETNLVLKCIDNIMYNFRFYDGASVSDVRYALTRGCGHSIGRGDFNVLESFQGGGGYHGEGGYFYGHGINLVIPKFLFLILSLNVILLIL
ncbi:Glycine-rich protein family [Rhynchospora pubera]|uniref:Glycine-rich protein family n=1 Tax=Rhynchospora pubera TaxID=906938 RepID=A0AAV8DSV5_9POAL|nr:Glycine-rich protein family [Rhynchospora pubera]KAJ4782673.1 Glycine-rich protein family [Rhynchospora pubera]KAJ4789570.1 Glycine-rich protein family [Rhynchospora pubera]